MVHYKLTYLNARGRAEIARIMFAEAGVEYEDHRIEFEDWPNIKPTVPFGKVPILYIDGRPLMQSGCINRYLAAQFGFLGDNPIQHAICDMVYETIREAVHQLPLKEKDEAKKKEGMKKVFEEVIVPVLKKMEEKHDKKEGTKDHMVGDKLTLADIAVANFLHELKRVKADCVDQFPGLCHVLKVTSERPNIKAWAEKRPKTDL
jgi:glutathione S-transferase